LPKSPAQDLIEEPSSEQSQKEEPLGADFSPETTVPHEPPAANPKEPRQTRPPDSPFLFEEAEITDESNTSQAVSDHLKATAAIPVSKENVLSYRIQRLQNSGRPHRLLIEAISGQDILTCWALLKSTHSNISGTRGRWPLHEAAMTGNRSLVELLLKETSNTFVSCNERKTALEYATESGEISVVRFMYEHFDSKRVLPKDWDIVEVLDRAIAIAVDNNYQDVKGFLSDKRCDVKDKKATADFLSAVTENNRKVVSAVLDTGFSVESALKLAIEKKFARMTALLLESTRPGRSYDWKGAIDAAAKLGDVKLVRDLLPRILDRVDQERAAHNALALLLQHGHHELSDVVIKSGTINRTNIWQAATTYGSLELVGSLIEDEDSELIEKKSINKSFHWACDQAINRIEKPTRRSLSLISHLLLFKNGADVDAYEAT
jgi:hypothetical protein